MTLGLKALFRMSALIYFPLEVITPTPADSERAIARPHLAPANLLSSLKNGI